VLFKANRLFTANKELQILLPQTAKLRTRNDVINADWFTRAERKTWEKQENSTVRLVELSPLRFSSLLFEHTQ
jgi:hypothetical protein